MLLARRFFVAVADGQLLADDGTQADHAPSGVDLDAPVQPRRDEGRHPFCRPVVGLSLLQGCLLVSTVIRMHNLLARPASQYKGG